MKLFLRRLFIAVLPIVIFFGAVELHCRTNTAIATKKDYIEQHAATAEVLILGDSHGHMGILPELISRPVATLAMGGQPLCIDYFLLRKYMDRMPKLKVVILEVSPHRFYLDLDPDNWNSRLYRITFDIDYKTERFDLRNYSLVLAAHRRSTLRFLAYYGLDGKLRHMKKYGVRLNEYTGRFGDLKYDEEKIAATFKLPHKFAGSIDSNRQFLVNIVELCKGRGISVVLVSTPLYRTYVKAIPVAAKQAVDSVLAGVAGRYGVLCLNYVNDTGFSIHDFWDDDHLSVSGSVKFMHMLNRDMQAAGVLKQ